MKRRARGASRSGGTEQGREFEQSDIGKGCLVVMQMHVIRVRVRVVLGIGIAIDIHVLNFVKQSVMYPTDLDERTLLPGAGAAIESYQSTNSHNHNHGRS